MNKKKFIYLLLVVMVAFLTFNMNSYAMIKGLIITSNDYSPENEMSLDEINYVEVGKTLQLYAIIGYTSGTHHTDFPNSMGWYVQETNLSGVTWASNNTEIARVDNTGQVTGVSEGETTITASYNGESVTYDIIIMPEGDKEYVGIHFIPSTEPMILNKEIALHMELYNIPSTEKENIKVTIDNENIAKLIEIGEMQNSSSSVRKMVSVYINLLSAGNTTITATLNYNGKIYSDSYELSVLGSSDVLTIYAKNYLPHSLEVGEKIQLGAMFGNSLTFPEDVTTKGVSWSSSDEHIAKIDNNGFLTVMNEGTATIIAKFKVGDKTVENTYNLVAIDSEIGDKKNTKIKLPQVMENVIILLTGISLGVLATMIIYKRKKL